MLDSGSDEHVCRPEFGQGCPSTPGDADGGLLDDAQGTAMKISDTRRVPFGLFKVDQNTVVAEASLMSGKSF